MLKVTDDNFQELKLYISFYSGIDLLTDFIQQIS